MVISCLLALVCCCFSVFCPPPTVHYCLFPNHSKHGSPVSSEYRLCSSGDKRPGRETNHSPSDVPPPEYQGSQYAILSIQVVIGMNGHHLTLITLVNKVLSPEEKCLFLVYFWTLNSNMFPEFLYHMFPEFLCHPHLSRCIRLYESTSLHMSHWGSLGGGLDML